MRFSRSKFKKQINICFSFFVFKLENDWPFGYTHKVFYQIFQKTFEKLIYLQLNNYKQNKCSIYLTGFQKNHGTQQALLKMTETWQTKFKYGS